MHNKYNIFDSRIEAGNKLAELLKEDEFEVLEIIPNGGLPVGYELLQKIPTIDFVDIMIVKKVHLPQTTEAGMGAITPDGEIFLNKELISNYSIHTKQIQSQIEETTSRIKLIKTEFGIIDQVDVKNKSVLIIDDGIASGFSMLAGVNWLQKRKAKKIIIGVPTAPLTSLLLLEEKVDKIYCANIRESFSFAVADAYKNWYDLTLSEAIMYFNKIRKILKQ